MMGGLIQLETFSIRHEPTIVLKSLQSSVVKEKDHVTDKSLFKSKLKRDDNDGR
jgi:hypothetical protein